MPFCVAILATGQMGASFAPCLSSAGVRLVTNLTNRSPRTQHLAAQGGFEDLHTDEAVLAQADIILSIVVPSQALPLAERLASAGARMLTLSQGPPIRTKFFADLNAISPATTSAVGAALRGLPSIQFVDGGIIGGPATATSAPLLALSGAGAAALHALLGPWVFGRTKVVGGEVGQASALKLSYAALTKGSIGLATNVALLADQFGVGEALEEELAESQPALLKVVNGVPRSTAKAFRWVGEMEEISSVFASTGLAGGSQIFTGMARTYDFVAANKELGHEPIEEALAKKRTLADVVRILKQDLLQDGLDDI